MNFDYLNEMIKYIEKNLENEINFNELSKITNTNIFILERIFMFLTNMTVTEYIKKRRLSKAFEDIRNTNSKIINIAFKYQYNSASSFNRAFKKLFKITPTECRKGIGNYKIIPIQHFEINKNTYNLNYEIKKTEKKTIYCYHITAKKHSDLLYKIRQLYKNISNTTYYNEFNKVGMYGIFSKNNNTYNYYLGSTKHFSELEKHIMEEGEYAIFNLKSKNQEDIVKFEEKINKQWIPSTNYKIKNNTRIELYKNDSCYIYLPIK